MKRMLTMAGAVAALMLLAGCAYDDGYGYGGYSSGYGYGGGVYYGESYGYYGPSLGYGYYDSGHRFHRGRGGDFRGGRDHGGRGFDRDHDGGRGGYGGRR